MTLSSNYLVFLIKTLIDLNFSETKFIFKKILKNQLNMKYKTKFI